MPNYPLTMAAAIKTQLGTLNQPETTALRDNSRRLPHTIASLLPPDPKYEHHNKRLIPQSGLAYTHTHPHTTTLSTVLQEVTQIFDLSLYSAHPHINSIIIMPSQQATYVYPPGSKATGFFPSGPTAPHAFATMHTSPRDQHLMYASLGTPSFQFQIGKSSTKSASKGSGKKQR